MLHYVQHLVANFVCLLLDYGQVVYSRFVRVFFTEMSSLLWLDKGLMRAEFAWWKNQNNQLKEAKKFCRAVANMWTITCCRVININDTFHITHNNLIDCYYKKVPIRLPEK